VFLSGPSVIIVEWPESAVRLISQLVANTFKRNLSNKPGSEVGLHSSLQIITEATGEKVAATSPGTYPTVILAHTSRQPVVGCGRSTGGYKTLCKKGRGGTVAERLRKGIMLMARMRVGL